MGDVAGIPRPERPSGEGGRDADDTSTFGGGYVPVNSCSDALTSNCQKLYPIPPIRKTGDSK